MAVISEPPYSFLSQVLAALYPVLLMPSLLTDHKSHVTRCVPVFLICFLSVECLVDLYRATASPHSW